MQASDPKLSCNLRAYMALCDKAAEAGWPEHYKDDLYYHDHERLFSSERGAVGEGHQFAWLVRNTGTWIVATDEDHELILAYVERYESKSHRAYWWDGRRLTEIPVMAVRANLGIAARLWEIEHPLTEAVA